MVKNSDLTDGRDVRAVAALVRPFGTARAAAACSARAGAAHALAASRRFAPSVFVALFVNAAGVFDGHVDAAKLRRLTGQDQLDLQCLGKLEQLAAGCVFGRDRLDAIRGNAKTELAEPAFDVCELFGAKLVVQMLLTPSTNATPAASIFAAASANGMAPKASERMPAFQPSSATAVPRGRRLSGGRVCMVVFAPPPPSTRGGV